MKTVYFILIFFLFTSISYAGNIDSINSLKIYGNGFGTKNCSNIIFKNFENGTNGSTLQSIDSDWKEFNSKGGALYDNQKSYGGSLSAYNYVNSISGGRHAFATNYLTVSGSSEIYINYKIQYVGTGSKYGIGKACRINSSESSGGGGYYNGAGDTQWGNINFYYISRDEGGGGFCSYNNGIASYSFGGFDYNDVVEGTWLNIEMYKKLSTAGMANGIVFCDMVGVSNNLSESAITLGTGQTFQIDTILLGVMYENIGAYGGDASMKIWIDNLYISYGNSSRARVEIGNNIVFSSCTHREIQTPVVWSDTEITLSSWNNGSFVPGDRGYLFVIDADGNASAGYDLGTLQADGTWGNLKPIQAGNLTATNVTFGG